MANRVIEVLYKLKDLFTGQVSKIVGGYRDIDSQSSASADRVERNNSRISRSFEGFARAVGSVRTLWIGLSGALAAGGALRGLKAFADEADKVGKLSEKLGVASEELSALGYAAERSNISFDTMATAIQRMIRRAAEAANGTGEAKDALRALNINAQDFTKLSLEEKMAELADAMEGVDDQGQRVALAMKLFDTEGVAMVQVLQNGSEAMRSLLNEARSVGAVFDEETTKAAAEFNNTLTKLSATATGIKIGAGTPLLNFANDLAAKFDISADRSANLRAELEYLEDRLNNRLTFSPYDYYVSAQALLGIRDLRAEYEAVAAELESIEKATEGKAAADEAAAEAAKVHADVLADQARQYESVAESAEYALKARKEALATETAELRKAKAEQLSIEQEFQDLVDGITKKEKEDVALGDVFGANNQARAALAKGETDEAVRLAREGGELLTKLKEKGTETSGTLAFLAKQLQDVAKQASASKVESEQKDRDIAANAAKTMEAQVAVMKNVAEGAGAAAGIAFADAMQAAMSRITLQPPAVAPAAPQISRNGNAFTDGTDWRGKIEKWGVK